MRDSRRTRELAVIMFTAALGAVIGDYFLKPALNRKLGVKS